VPLGALPTGRGPVGSGRTTAGAAGTGPRPTPPDATRSQRTVRQADASPTAAQAPAVVRGRLTTSVTEAAVFVAPEDAAGVATALDANGFHAVVTDAPADALAAVVRGAGVLVVDPARPDTAPLLRTVRRRILDGWSDCAVVACVAPWLPLDDEVASMVDALARRPVTAAELDLSVRVARAQRDDPHGSHDRGRPPVAPAPRPTARLS
jgi:hypothetical protein